MKTFIQIIEQVTDIESGEKSMFEHLLAVSHIVEIQRAKSAKQSVILLKDGTRASGVSFMVAETPYMLLRELISHDLVMTEPDFEPMHEKTKGTKDRKPGPVKSKVMRDMMKCTNYKCNPPKSYCADCFAKM